MLVAQFSYATVPEPGPYSDVDGWKVKQVLPEGADVRGWVDRSTSSLGAFMPAPLPLLVSQSEIDELPRRMRLEAYPARKVTLLHQVSAGQSHHQRDASFTHGLLISCESGIGLQGVRPAELWDSPGWLRPADSDQVSAAVLASPLNLGVHPNVPSVEQLWSAHRELALLLLAITENAFTGGVDRSPSRIALVDPTGATTAAWVSFLSRHLTPGAAWQQLTFSTHERSVEANVSALSTLRVIGIPADEASGARRALGADWLVVDPADPPARSAGPAAGWHLPGGRRLVIGPWTALAERLTLLDEMGMPSLGEQIDRLAARCGGSADDRPLWAVPAALLTADPEVLNLMVQVAPDAAELAQQQWPVALAMPAEPEQKLAQSLRLFSSSPISAFETILRSADREPDPITGGSDLALHGYLTALWSPDGEGRPPEWVRTPGRLPWLPVKVRPGAALADSMLEALTGLLGWVWTPAAPTTVPVTAGGEVDPPTAGLVPADPVAIARLLSGVAEIFTRWGLEERPPVSTQVIPRLVSSMVASLRAQTPVTESSWPALRAPVLEQVRSELTALINQDASYTLGPAPAHWLEQQYGPLDARRPLQQWTVLDLDRVLYLPEGQAQDRGAPALRAAGILRRAISQVPGRWWSTETWLAGLRHVFGPVADPDAARWFLQIVVDREVPAPVLAIGDAVLAGLPLAPAPHAFGRWLAGAPVTGSVSMVPFGRAELARFPAVCLHAWCRPDPPISGELSGDGEFLRELETLTGMVRYTSGPLRDSVLLRLTVDILLVDSAFMAGGLLPVRGPELDGWLGEKWETALEQLDDVSAGQPHRRLALARSLFVRALIGELVAETGAAGTTYHDPAAPWLTNRPDPQKAEWVVEPWVKELIDGVDRPLRQRWVADVREEAAMAARLLAGNRRAGPADTIRDHSGTSFTARLLQMVDSNAPSLALGALGSRLPFNRARPRKADDVPGSGKGSAATPG